MPLGSYSTVKYLLFSEFSLLFGVYLCIVFTCVCLTFACSQYCLGFTVVSQYPAVVVSSNLFCGVVGLYCNFLLI